MPDYNYWLSGNPDDVRLQCVEIAHPAWSKVYRIVQNHADGVTVVAQPLLGVDAAYRFHTAW